MQSTLYNGLYIGPVVRMSGVTLKPGKLVKIAHVEVTPGFSYWEAANLRAKGTADWPKVDRLDLVIPGQEAEADQLRMLLTKPVDTRYLQEA